MGLLLAFFLNGVVTSMTGLTYAELGAAYPQAGGGYAWVKEGLARVFGFYAGWLSWFSHSSPAASTPFSSAPSSSNCSNWPASNLATRP